MTGRGGIIIFVRFWRPPSPILNYLNDREGGGIIFCRILPPSPDATISNDLNDRERGAPLSCEGLRVQLLILCHFFITFLRGGGGGGGGAQIQNYNQTKIFQIFSCKFLHIDKQFLGMLLAPLWALATQT